MPKQPPTIYVIAGCNGAGKTTFAKEFLPKEVKCLRFLNADEIARGISPLRPSAGAIQAARFLRAQELGYTIEIQYLFLSSASQAVARVRSRVKKGGHHVPASDIRRRFKRSREHLLNDYLPLADRWAVWDSRSMPPKRIAISSGNDIEFVRSVTSL